MIKLWLCLSIERIKIFNLHRGIGFIGSNYAITIRYIIPARNLRTVFFKKNGKRALSKWYINLVEIIETSYYTQILRDSIIS